MFCITVEQNYRIKMLTSVYVIASFVHGESRIVLCFWQSHEKLFAHLAHTRKTRSTTGRFVFRFASVYYVYIILGLLREKGGLRHKRRRRHQNT